MLYKAIVTLTIYNASFQHPQNTLNINNILYICPYDKEQ